VSKRYTPTLRSKLMQARQMLQITKRELEDANEGSADEFTVRWLQGAVAKRQAAYDHAHADWEAAGRPMDMPQPKQKKRTTHPGGSHE
jgi:hypothetical protein